MHATYWVIPHLLAGRCGPRQAPWDLNTFRRAGIRLIVSLTDVGLSPVETGAHGMVLHECWLPMSALVNLQERTTVLRRLQPVLQAIDEAHQRGDAVLTHCAMGIDRTGLLLGCVLVMREGLQAGEAIERIHDANPAALQLEGYQAAVRDFAAMWDPAQRRIKMPGFTKGLTSFIRAEDTV